LSKKEKKQKEKDILKKVEDYRLKLNEDLLALLSDERQKDENREKTVKETLDFDTRKRLEKAYGIERAQASYKIINFNT